ncbi:pif1, partial [Symbiodinium sp. KB8]
VPQTSPVTCEDDAAQAGRTDPHPDTFQVYHSRGQICAKRTDAHSHWGVNLVLYCRKGGWDSGFWSTSGGRVLEDSFSQDVKDPGARSPVEHPSWPMLAILPGFAAVLLGALFYSAPCRRNPSDALLLQADPEDANSNERKAR